MRLTTEWPVKLVPIGPMATATEVEISRGPYSTTRSIDVILPSKNKGDLTEQVMKRELIIRAWLSGTTGQQGGSPIHTKNPLFKQNVNTGSPGAGIFSGRGRVFMGNVREPGDGTVVIPWGPSDTNTPYEAVLIQTELDFPSAEDPLETAIPLIAGYLASRDPNAPCAPGVKVSDATRLYQKIIDLVASYDFPYITF